VLIRPNVMSFTKGITTWIWRAGRFTVAYRHNMRAGEAMRTFRVCHGQHTALAIGPFLAEW